MTLEEIKTNNNEFISIKEMAKFLGKDPQVLRNDIRNGKSNIPHIISGRHIYVLRTAFLKTIGG